MACFTLFFILITVAKIDIQQNHLLLRLHWKKIVSITFWIVIFIEVTRVILCVKEGLIIERCPSEEPMTLVDRKNETG